MTSKRGILVGLVGLMAVLVAFVYGVTVGHYKLFPHRQITEAYVLARTFIKPPPVRTDESNLIPLVVQMGARSVSKLPFVIAVDQGLYKKYGLDVNLVAHLILSSLWNIPESDWESVLQFTHSTEEALRKAVDGEAVAVFLLRPPKVEVLIEMGKSQELMPQKSTYFFPKLASGLVFYQHS